MLASSLISSDIVVCSSSACLSSIASSPLLSLLNHVMCPLSETVRSRLNPVLSVITIFRLLAPDGDIHIAGFCCASLSPRFGIGVVVSFVAGGIQNISLPRVGETS